MARKVLSDAEGEAYEREGQLTPKHRPADALLARLTDCIETLIAENADIRPEQLVGAHVKKSDDTGVRGVEALLDCACHDDILDAVEQVMGRDLILWGSQVFSKPAGDGLA